MKFNLAIMLMVSSFLNCAEMSQQEKEELAQNQLVAAAPPGGAVIMQGVAEQLDKNEIIKVLNKATKLVIKDEELINFIKNIILRVKKDEIQKSLNLIKVIQEEKGNEGNSREMQIIKELQILLESNPSHIKLKYLKQDELIEIKKLNCGEPCLSISWSGDFLYCIYWNRKIEEGRNNGYYYARLGSQMAAYNCKNQVFSCCNFIDSPFRISLSPNGKFLAVLCLKYEQRCGHNYSHPGEFILSLSLLDASNKQVLATTESRSYRSFEAWFDHIQIHWDNNEPAFVKIDDMESINFNINNLINKVSYSTDNYSLSGKKFAQGNDSKVEIREANTKKLLYELNEHNAKINSCDFSSDSRQLISSSNDQTLRLWDVETGEQLDVIDMENDKPGLVCWSPCGTMLAVICGNNVKIFKRNA